MKQGTTNGSDVTMGIDLGDRYSHLCVLSPDGEVVERARLRTRREDFARRFQGSPAARIAIECGTHSPWVSRMLEEWGHTVLVANPYRLRMIYENDKKDDDVDAEQLARVARMDPNLLYPIRHRSEKCHADLMAVRARRALVEARTKLVNAVRGSVKPFGVHLPKCSTRSFHRTARKHLPEPMNALLEPLLEQIEQLTQQIARYDRHVQRMAEQKYPETKALRQVTGVGPLLSVTYVLTLEDPGRFKKSRSVGPYLGLRPTQAKSGDRDPQLRITKAGDGYLRKLLVGAAHYILGPFGPDTDLRRWGLNLCARGGKNAKKRAVVAVARRLAVLLHRLWVTQQTYEPLRQAHSRRRTA